MASSRSAAALIGVAALVCGCGQSGGGAASSQPAASSAPPAVSSAPPPAPSDTAPSSAAASALPPVAVAPPPPPAPPSPTRAAAAAPQQREPSPGELLRNDPAYQAKERAVEALYQNAKERDPTGQVEQEQGYALTQLHACPNRACLDTWFSRREAALRQYVN